MAVTRRRRGGGGRQRCATPGKSGTRGTLVCLGAALAAVFCLQNVIQSSLQAPFVTDIGTASVAQQVQEPRKKHSGSLFVTNMPLSHPRNNTEQSQAEQPQPRQTAATPQASITPFLLPAKTDLELQAAAAGWTLLRSSDSSNIDDHNAHGKKIAGRNQWTVPKTNTNKASARAARVQTFSITARLSDRRRQQQNNTSARPATQLPLTFDKAQPPLPAREIAETTAISSRTETRHPREDNAVQAMVAQYIRFHPRIQHQQQFTSVLDRSFLFHNGTLQQGDPTFFCVSWRVHTDDWWTHHPHWFVAHENATHFCFATYQHQAALQLDLMTQLYQVQFQNANCSSLLVKRMWSSGWGADFINIVDGLEHALQTQRPVQIQETQPWHYADPHSVKPALNGTYIPPACDQRNMYCYLLPLSQCRSGATKGWPGKLYEEYFYDLPRYWRYMEFVVRPQQWLRHQVYQWLQHQPQPALPDNEPCAVLHVRRHDVILHSIEARRYHSIKEYMDAVAGKVHSHILLLTDDANAITEAQVQYPNYTWHILQRPRFRGTEGGWERHIPSMDPTFDVKVLLATFQLVRRCTQLIHSHGKFADYLYYQMTKAHPAHEILRVNIDDTKELFGEILSNKNVNTGHISKNYDVLVRGSNGNATTTATTAEIERRAAAIPTSIEAQGETFDFDGIIGTANNIRGDRTFCIPWNVNADAWWTHNPQFERGAENATHYCFNKIPESSSKAVFMQKLYDIQFHGDCSDPRFVTKRMWSSGWGADMENLVDGLARAMDSGVPMQVNHAAWHYAMPKFPNGTSMIGVVQPACPNMTMACYFLALGSCPPASAWTINEETNTPWLAAYQKANDEYPWYLLYLTRPQTWLRKRIYEYTSEFLRQTMKTPCTVLHVRRNDVIMHGKEARKYHAIEEYLEYAANQPRKVVVHPNIFLLTDDQNAIEEAHAEFPHYNWMYFKRPRFRGNQAGWEQHLPSLDPVHEVVVILSTFDLVQQCDQLIHSRSNFVDHLIWSMRATGKQLTVVDIDGRRQHHEVKGAQNNASVIISRRYSTATNEVAPKMTVQ